jgi:hypothetical protein
MLLNDDDFKKAFAVGLAKMEREYPEQAEQLLRELDFEKLAEIRKKKLQDLTEADLETLGLCPMAHEEVGGLYFCSDLNNIKIYLNRVNDKFELRGYRLRKEKDILTTAELFDETITKWRLKM